MDRKGVRRVNGTLFVKMHSNRDNHPAKGLFFLSRRDHITGHVLQKEAFMIRCVNKELAAFAAVGLALAVVGPAQAETVQKHSHAHRYTAVHYARSHEAANESNEVIVHTGRNYPTMVPTQPLENGAPYFVDTALATDPGQDYPFGIQGQSVLPSRFNPPGQDEPLFRFW
jgi:hypothetical protein